MASLSAWAAETPRYAGRELQDVLDDLRGTGLPLIYSTDLVRPGMKVKDEPRSRDPRGMLDEVLEPHGLRASPGPAGTLVVAKAAAAQAPPDGSADDALRLGFRDRADVPGGSPPEVVAAGTVRFGAREVLGMPGAVDKVFRALQVVPGITGAGRGTVFSAAEVRS